MSSTLMVRSSAHALSSHGSIALNHPRARTRKPQGRSRLPFLAASCAALSLVISLATPASATLTVTAQEGVGNVVVSALGTIDFSTFFNEAVGSASPPGLPGPPVSYLATADLFGTPTIHLVTTGSAATPVSALNRRRSYAFASGTVLTGMPSTLSVPGGQIGQPFGFFTLTAGDFILYTPPTFDPTIDPVLSYTGLNQFTLPGVTLADLGMMPGTRTWTAGGVDVARLVALPVPGPLGLLAAPSGWYWIRRLRRRHAKHGATTRSRALQPINDAPGDPARFAEA